MIANLQKLHTIKSERAGLLSEPDRHRTWKGMLLSIFEGGDFAWQKISKREGLDRDLILSSVEKMLNRINKMEFREQNYSLLHTDFNARNLFVDQESDEITGIIDWEEAMFGDPIYDYARIRMYLWHYNLGEDVISKYYYLVKFTPEERKLEDLYWLSRVIQYLAWYSTDLNEYNRGRIELHQKYLREYNWGKAIKPT
jgi:aminoglycoside phosphotransferase (APT) family kinase protein